MTEERVKRKLSAILSADVVGYSRLMDKDEVATYYRLGTGNPVSRDEIVSSIPVFDGLMEYLDSPKEALTKLHQLYSDEDNLMKGGLEDEN